MDVAANLPGVVVVRDSTDPDGARLIFAPAEWDAFTAGGETASSTSAEVD